MLLQTLFIQQTGQPAVLSETPWHDAASNQEAYRDRLRQYLGGFFEQDGSTMQPKAELMIGDAKQIPNAVRLLDDAGAVLDTYRVEDLERDTGMQVTQRTSMDTEDNVT